MSEGVEIVQPGRPDVKPFREEKLEIARQRRGLAGDVDEKTAGAASECPGERRSEAGARRIRHRNVEAFPAPAEESEGFAVVDRPRAGPPAPARGLRLLDGGVVGLHRDNRVARVEERSREKADAPEEVERVARADRGGFPGNPAIEGLEKMPVRLEKSPGGQRKLMPPDGNPEASLSPARENGPFGVRDRDSVEEIEQGI